MTAVAGTVRGSPLPARLHQAAPATPGCPDYTGLRLIHKYEQLRVHPRQITRVRSRMGEVAGSKGWSQRYSRTWH